MAWHVVETASTEDDSPRELSLYATESYFTGNVSRLRRYTLRLDGFASVFAPLEGGECLTKPFTFTGKALYINFATSARRTTGCVGRKALTYSAEKHLALYHAALSTGTAFGGSPSSPK